MSQENVEAHKRGVEAISRRDIEALLEEVRAMDKAIRRTASWGAGDSHRLLP